MKDKNLEIRKEAEDYIFKCGMWLQDKLVEDIGAWDLMQEIGKKFNPEDLALTTDERQALLNRFTRVFGIAVKVASKKHIKGE